MSEEHTSRNFDPSW